MSKLPLYIAEDIPLKQGSVTDERRPSSVRSWATRSFSPMGPGSQRASTLALCSTAFGSGVLALPWVFASLGIPAGIASILASGILVVWSLRTLANCAFVTQTTEYSALARQVLHRSAGIFISILLFVYAFGSVWGYLIFVAQIVHPHLITHVGGREISPNDVIIFAFFLLLLPSTLPVTGLRHVTPLSLMGLIIVVFCIFIQAPISFHPDDWYEPHLNGDWTIVPKCIAICFYSFCSHVNFFNAYSSLENPIPRRVGKVIYRAAGVQAVVYCCVGVCGFLAFGPPCESEHQTRCTPVNVLATPRFLGSLSCVARICMVIALAVAIPMNNIAGVQQVELIMARLTCGDPTCSPWVHHLRRFLVTTAFYASCALLAMSEVQISDLLSITGGFCAVTFMFTIPIAMNVVLRRRRLITFTDCEGRLLGSFLGISRFGTRLLTLATLPAILIGYLAASIGVCNMG